MTLKPGAQGWWVGVVLGLMLLSSSIVLNVVLYDRARQYYRELNQTRLDPLGLNDRPPMSLPQPEEKTLRVVFFGDSRAAAWVPPNLQGYEFINAGISSQTSSQTLQRLPLQLPPLKPDVVVVQVGINDLKTIALFPNRKAEIIRRCRGNLYHIVQEIQSLGAVAIVTTIFPSGDITLLRRPLWSPDIDLAVQDLNAYLATLAGPKVWVLDAFTLLSDDRGKVLAPYQADELHLTPAGYAPLNQALGQILQSLTGQS
ncbi:MAG: SGNH/GDSL hydrolase family protein [Prochlorotrichaceae cyanobacterium]|jgi:lysophospholipase L1-like esterase